MSFINFAGIAGNFGIFAFAVALVAISILLYICFMLFKSHLIAILAFLCDVGGIIFLFTIGLILTGGLLAFFTVAVICFSVLYLYKNVRGALWWSIGGILGFIATPIFTGDKVEIDVDAIISALIPLAIFFVVGLLGGILVPRVMFKKRKNERKHLTNTEPMIGKKIVITKDSEGEFPARGLLGDVDWSIKPLFPYEHFKVGDVVKVNKIEGVTLVCIRDGKDLRSEMRAQRAADNAAAKAEYQAKRAERDAKKAAKLNEKVAAQKAKKEEKVMKETKSVTATEKVASKKSNITNIITIIVLFILCAIVVFASIKFKDTFYPTGTLIYSGIILIYVFALFTYKILKGRNNVQVVEKVVIKEVPVEVEKKVIVKEVKVETPAPAPVVPEPKAKAAFVPFAIRMKKADSAVKAAYNELKSEILSYGIKSRVSNTGDTFRLHTKEYVKMVIAGKTLKMYLALNPKDYKGSSIPHDDASSMSAHKETPFVFKVKSPLAVRRAKTLIAECAKKDGLVQGEVIAHNHAKDVK